MENLIITDNKIYIPKDPDCESCGDKIIMQDTVSVYEQKVAEKLCVNGGDILEIGFGLGISANKIQTYNIDSHVIIESRHAIYGKAVEWAKDKQNITVYHGDWYNIIPKLNKTFDGIYNDADEGTKDLLSNFPEMCKRIAKNGCLLFMTNWGNEYLERSLQYYTYTQDDNGQSVFGEITSRIPYATFTNSEWV